VEIQHDILHGLYGTETPISQKCLKLLTFKDTYGVADVLHEGLIQVLHLFHVSERLGLITSVTPDTLDDSLRKVKNCKHAWLLNV
jgi:hypothetical protein